MRTTDDAGVFVPGEQRPNGNGMIERYPDV